MAVSASETEADTPTVSPRLAYCAGARGRGWRTAIALIVGGELATNVKPRARLPLFVPTVTTTSTDPAACCGVTAVSVVSLTNATPVAGVPPTVIDAP